jgi:hypothetical protein
MDEHWALLLYTDGLVERRDRDVDDGVGTLAGLLHDLAAETPVLEDLADRLLVGMTGERPEDDVALLLLRLT